MTGENGTTIVTLMIQVNQKKKKRMNQMKMNKVIKHKLPATHEEWLDNRLKGIGGSDAGSVLGMNKYKSVYALCVCIVV